MTLIKDVVEEFENNKSVIKKNIKFNVTREKPNGVGTDISGMRERLEQVLANLIDNAVSFSPNESNITIGLNSNKDAVSFTIKDEGPGFSETNTEKIFKRFYSNRPEKFGKHSGLGLNIVKNIIEMHQGKITASNRTDNKIGAEIKVTLPKKS